MESNPDFLSAALVQSMVSVRFRLDPDPIEHLMDKGGLDESIKLLGSRFIGKRFEFKAYIK
ncbi:hypothetical protein [Paenibacillus odorifer]|uniref:hypothetical protein n=1 Tax=Paenibacillus odorifer TaxID=189426 RepID=UPI0015C30B7D|nr:hypothetical protein [Paenibacillus odorifer]